MENQELEIIWDKVAVNDFYKILEYLNQTVPHLTEEIADKIVVAIKVLGKFPFMYQQDRFRKDNDKNYRALIVYNYRIAYKVTHDCVLVLRIRHVSQEPLNY